MRERGEEGEGSKAAKIFDSGVLLVFEGLERSVVLSASLIRGGVLPSRLALPIFHYILLFLYSTASVLGT